MFVDDSACNLASLNLMKFRTAEAGFDVERFLAAVRIFIIAQDILVDNASYPVERIARNSHLFRPLGLGYANLGALLMSYGLPYDSDGGRAVAATITAILTGQAYSTSSELAENTGTFEEFGKNAEPMTAIIDKHRRHVEKIESDFVPEELIQAAKKVWEKALASGRKTGFRNAQATVLAPTGTIGFMMDCDTTGIEPEILLVKYKELAGGGVLKIVNRTVSLALKQLGYSQQDISNIIKYMEENEHLEDCPHLKDEHLPVFDCAFRQTGGKRNISYMGHIRMMGAVQPFLSGAISKTVNVPKETDLDEIEKVYMDGWKMGLKAVAIYRDGSKQAQPINIKKKKDEPKEEPRVIIERIVEHKPLRRRLSDTRRSITHKFEVAGHEGYLTVGLHDDGRPGELFITMAKEGSTVGGLMDAFGTAISLALQYGVPLDALVTKFTHQHFEPAGMTRNPDIRFASSIVDYIFRWLGVTFMPGYREKQLPTKTAPRKPEVWDWLQIGKEKSESGEKISDSRLTKAQRFSDNASRTVDAGGATDLPDGPSDSPKGGEQAASAREGASRSQDGSDDGGNGSSGNKKTAVSAKAAGKKETGLAVAEDPTEERLRGFQSDAPTCPICGRLTVRNGSCYKCLYCGNSLGCS
jgi:ribonucleoside-diphosphate reductase alpha chain